jgi:hypothetical protein
LGLVACASNPKCDDFPVEREATTTVVDSPTSPAVATEPPPEESTAIVKSPPTFVVEPSFVIAEDSRPREGATPEELVAFTRKKLEAIAAHPEVLERWARWAFVDESQPALRARVVCGSLHGVPSLWIVPLYDGAPRACACDGWGHAIYFEAPGPIHRDGWDLYSSGADGVDDRCSGDDLSVGKRLDEPTGTGRDDPFDLWIPFPLRDR